ncbi:MAG: hypothetical protein R3D34_04860 [Nitratireductor sp.]
MLPGLMLVTRSRKMNETLLHRAWNGATDRSLFAGAKNDGIQALRRICREHVGIDRSLAKHHAIAFAFTKSGENPLPHACTGTE